MLFKIDKKIISVQSIRNCHTINLYIFFVTKQTFFHVALNKIDVKNTNDLNINQIQVAKVRELIQSRSVNVKITPSAKFRFHPYQMSATSGICKFRIQQYTQFKIKLM